MFRHALAITASALLIPTAAGLAQSGPPSPAPATIPRPATRPLAGTWQTRPVTVDELRAVGFDSRHRDARRLGGSRGRGAPGRVLESILSGLEQSAFGELAYPTVEDASRSASISFAVAPAAPTLSLAPGEQVVEAEGIEDRDFQHAADRDDVAEPGDFVGTGDGLLALAAETTEPPGLRGFLGLVRVVPVARRATGDRRRAAGTTIRIDLAARSAAYHRLPTDTKR